MILTIDEAIRELKEQYAVQRLIPFIGAGMSMPSGYSGWTSYLKKLRKQTREEINKLSVFTTKAVNASLIKGRWVIVAEVRGPTVMTAKQVDTIQSKLKATIKKDLLFLVFSRAEAMISGKSVENELKGMQTTIKKKHP